VEREPAIPLRGVVKRYGEIAAVKGSTSTSHSVFAWRCSGRTAPASRRRLISKQKELISRNFVKPSNRLEPLILSLPLWS
jgi:hypothetical protein